MIAVFHGRLGFELESKPRPPSWLFPDNVSFLALCGACPDADAERWAKLKCTHLEMSYPPFG